MKTSSINTRRALTLLEVLVALGTPLVLVALVLPRLAGSGRSELITCQNNLKQVGLGFRIWQGDHGDKFPMGVSMTNGGTAELIENGKVFPHFQIMSNELYNPKMLICPSDKGRHVAANFGSNLNDSRLSFFIGVDAVANNPTMLLAGDRNLTLNKTALNPGLIKLCSGDAVGWTDRIHSIVGNVLMADGSAVQPLSHSALEEALKNTGMITNRLALP